MKVNREELLKILTAVSPGLAQKEMVEQTTCFVFRDGEVCTFNEEQSCSMKLPWDGFPEGAIQSKPLLELLKRLKGKTLNIGVKGGSLRISIDDKESKTRKMSQIRLEQEITLPVEHVEKPGKWKKLPKDFIKAIDMVRRCASEDESQFVLTCVHIHPDFIEACDDEQVAHYKIKTGLKSPTLIRAKSLQHIVSLNPTEFSETEKWFHFKMGSGAVLSCCRYVEEFSDTASVLEVDGTEATIPKDIGETIGLATVFSSDNVLNDSIFVKFSPGQMVVEGHGSNGWYKEKREVDYDGPSVGFRIEPQLLLEIAKRGEKCVIGEGRLCVSGKDWVYVSSTSVIDGEDE